MSDLPVPRPRRVATDEAEALRSLCETGDLLILCGAGVSMVAPTRLPSGRELLESTLLRVVQNPRLSPVLREVFADERWPEVVPETVFQQILDVCGSLPDGPFTPLMRATSNGVHRWIARLAQRPGVVVATTNFDRLLTVSGVADVIHLHGSVDDFGSMVTTIRRVGRGLAGEVAERFSAALSRCTRLVVLGYSGNDRDVMGLIEENPPEHVVWSVPPATTTYPPALAPLVGKCEVTVLSVDLADLGVAPNGKASGRPRVIRPRSSRWRANDAQQIEILAGCLQNMDRYQSSIRLLADRWDDAQYAEGAGDLAVRLCHAYNIEDEQAQAIRIAAAALALRPPRADTAVRLLNERALAYIDSIPPEFTAAKSDLDAAVQMLDRCDPIERELMEARTLHNSAYLETKAFETRNGGDLRVAADKYRRAVELKRRIGDVLYLQTSLRNLAAVLRVLGTSDAEEVASDFYRIADRYALRWSRAYLPRLTAFLLYADGRSDEAAPYLAEALELFTRLDDQAMIRELLTLKRS